MKYATFTADGSASGHYDDAVHGKSMPDGVVAITDAQWELSMDGRLRIHDGALVEIPAQPTRDHVIDGANWRLDFDKMKSRVRAELKAACEAACRAGWVSNALGSPHTYDTDKDRDQVTLTALGVAALQQIVLGNSGWSYDVTCIDGTGVKAMRPHTADQLAQVCGEIQVMIRDNKARYYQLLADLDAAYQAGDEQAMLAIGW